jgi:hypothetical protein
LIFADEAIFSSRDKLLDFMRRRATAAAVVISPIVDDDRTTAIFSRLFEEEGGQRFFTVHFARPGEDTDLDWYFKDRGLDDEKRALGVITNSDERRFETLWNAYFYWMHEKADEPAIDKLLAAAKLR